MDLMYQADASGKIAIDGATWPVSYRVIAAAESAGARNVHVELSVPRDWLLERGFTSHARLVRESGEELEVRSTEPLDTDAPIAIVLQSEAASIASAEEIGRQFPELRMH
ncbi:MAG: hypothetical protein KL863_09795 [Rhizobium sp.]|nr:hypothetical protein [Rhizobium sp.]